MARTKSALKAHRASLRKRRMNTGRENMIDKLVHDFVKKTNPTADDFRLLQKAFDKAAKTGLYHPRKVARMKSRFARQVGKTSDAKSTKKTATKSSKKAAKNKKK